MDDRLDCFPIPNTFYAAVCWGDRQKHQPTGQAVGWTSQLCGWTGPAKTAVERGKLNKLKAIMDNSRDSPQPPGATEEQLQQSAPLTALQHAAC